jgi:hypothetical protein
MLSKTRSTSYSPASGLIPDTIPGTVGDRTHVELSLVWLVLFAAILGRLVGLVATAGSHWRTRAPRPGKNA